MEQKLAAEMDRQKMTRSWHLHENDNSLGLSTRKLELFANIYHNKTLDMSDTHSPVLHTSRSPEILKDGVLTGYHFDWQKPEICGIL